MTMIFFTDEEKSLHFMIDIHNIIIFYFILPVIKKILLKLKISKVLMWNTNLNFPAKSLVKARQMIEMRQFQEKLILHLLYIRNKKKN